MPLVIQRPCPYTTTTNAFILLKLTLRLCVPEGCSALYSAAVLGAPPILSIWQLRPLCMRGVMYQLCKITEYVRAGIAVISLTTTLENLSRLHEMRTLISAWVFGCKQQILILVYFREKKKDNGEFIETLGVLESRLRGCSQERYQSCSAKRPARMALELLPLSLDMHLTCGHSWPQTLGSVAVMAALLFRELGLIAMGSTAREDPPLFLFPGIFSQSPE